MSSFVCVYVSLLASVLYAQRVKFLGCEHIVTAKVKALRQAKAKKLKAHKTKKTLRKTRTKRLKLKAPKSKLEALKEKAKALEEKVKEAEKVDIKEKEIMKI